VLELVEAAMDRLVPGDDFAAEAHRLRGIIDAMLNGVGEWGLSLTVRKGGGSRTPC